MLRDVQRGAPTEVDAINGAIVSAGESRGVPVPVNRTLWQLVKALEPADLHSVAEEPIERSLELLERKTARSREKVGEVQFGK